MATYSELQAQIADDIRRTNYTTQIQTAILAAIEFYQDQRFWFNEVRATTTTTAGDGTIAGNDLARWLTVPSDLQDIESMKITISGERVPMTYRTHSYLDEIDSGTAIGPPTDWAYFSDMIRLYPAPDAAYVLSIEYVKKFPVLTAGTDSNAWLVEGHELIRNHAEVDLYLHLLKDQEAANTAGMAEALALSILREKRDKRMGSGLIRKSL